MSIPEEAVMLVVDSFREQIQHKANVLCSGINVEILVSTTDDQLAFIVRSDALTGLPLIAGATSIIKKIKEACNIKGALTQSGYVFRVSGYSPIVYCRCRLERQSWAARVAPSDSGALTR
jgi:hypothetical protein